MFFAKNSIYVNFSSLLVNSFMFLLQKPMMVTIMAGSRLLWQHHSSILSSWWNISSCSSWISPLLSGEGLRCEYKKWILRFVQHPSFLYYAKNLLLVFPFIIQKPVNWVFKKNTFQLTELSVFEFKNSCHESFVSFPSLHFGSSSFK